jgi:amino acid transporter
MLTSEGRPRSLAWFHTGPLLFGDWGTSRLYVLGLAFYYTGHASVSYLTAMSLIMIAVAWAYTVVCRCFPNGGGTYAAAKQIHPTLAVIGATLLLCDYIVTAALSAVEGFHYFGMNDRFVVASCVGTITLIGVVNWLGAKSAGRLALAIAIAALVASMSVAILSIPMLGRGLSTLTTTVDGVTSPWQRWESLVRIVLALSGVEAVANMTGLMREPVARTAKWTIWPVLIEVVILNAIFALALNALPALQGVTTPHHVVHEIRAGLAPDAVAPEIKEYRNTALNVLSEHVGVRSLGEGPGRLFSLVTGTVFGLLLLSATNTAIMAMVAVMYSLSQDRELPKPLGRLNYFGVPWIGLIIACLLPTVVLLIEADVKSLGEMYAIGVVGAIAINFLSCAANRSLPIARWERRGIWILGVLMTLVELTIIVSKPKATMFAGVMVGSVLVVRWVVGRLAGAAGPAPEVDWLAVLRQQPAEINASKPRIMLAARGRHLAEFAVDQARRRGATLFGLYVRTLRVIDIEPGLIPKIEQDADAQAALGTAALLAQQAGVAFVPIYVTAEEIADEILDYTVTYGCDTLIMGKTKRSTVSRAIAGDVVSRVKQLLPEGVTLVQRSGDEPFDVPETTIGGQGDMPQTPA